MALDNLTQQLLFNQPRQKPQNKLDKFLGTPGGSFLMNILAQSGYSTMPQSPFGAIGKAALMTQQQQRQQGQDELQRRLVESQIGLNQFKATAQGLNPTASNVASTFEGENGNVWVFQRGNVNPIDTGVPFRKSRRFQENPDGSITLFGEDGEVLKTVRSAEDARTQIIDRKVTEEDASRAASSDKDIRAAEQTVFDITRAKQDVDEMLENVGITTTGPLGAVLQFVPGFDARDFAAVRDRVTSFLTLESINQMKQQSATGATGLGAVSEREFDALGAAVENLEQAQSPSQVKTRLRRLLAVLNRIEQTAREDIERAQNASGEDFSGFSIERE